MTSSRDQVEESGALRPRLRLSVPTLNISRLASPLSSPRKEKGKGKVNTVSSSGRGGLGNIRATKSQQFDNSGSSALHPPLSPTSLYSFSAQTVSGSESGSSGASLYSVSTGVDKRVSTSTTRSKLSWNRSTGCLISDDVGYTRSEETSSRFGSPRSSTFRSQLRESLFSTNSVNTFGIARVPKSSVSTSSNSSSQGRSPMSLEYAKHIVTDTAMRAEEKRLQAAVNNQLIGQTSGAKMAPVEKIRTGRGGAGAYTKVNKDIDAGLFPTTAALTREHDLRLAAQERQIIETSRLRSAIVRKTGRGGLGNVSTRKGRERQEKRKSSAANRKSDSELAKMSGRTKGKRRRNSIAHEYCEDDEERVGNPHRAHRRSGSTSSHTGSLSKRHSVRSTSTVHVRRKGMSRLWSTVANIGAKSNREKRREFAEFEIVELRPNAEHDEERASPLSPEAAAVSCIMSASAAASANRALALARLERQSRKIQLGEVLEEEAWIDEDRQDAGTTPIIPREDLKRHLQSLPSGNSDTKSRSLNTGHMSRIRSSLDHSADSNNTMRRHPFANAESGATVSRASIGTFGMRRNSFVYEKDEDDAESIVDPYMHSP
ncbi:hypothetical protein ACEPAF_5326 [Sanghuangporus sanghuang]